MIQVRLVYVRLKASSSFPCFPPLILRHARIIRRRRILDPPAVASRCLSCPSAVSGAAAATGLPIGELCQTSASAGHCHPPRQSTAASCSSSCGIRSALVRSNPLKRSVRVARVPYLLIHGRVDHDPRRSGRRQHSQHAAIQQQQRKVPIRWRHAHHSHPVTPLHLRHHPAPLSSPPLLPPPPLPQPPPPIISLFGVYC